MKRSGYPGAGNRYWTCPGCKQKRRGAICNTCLVKREDVEKAAAAPKSS